MTPAAAGRPKKKKFKFFKSKERIPSPPPPPRIREEDFLSEEEAEAPPLPGIQEGDFHSEEEEEEGGKREILREAVVDRSGKAQEAEELQNSLASEFRVENRRGAQDDGEFSALTICRMYRQRHAPCRVISKLRCRSETLYLRDIFITYAT